jgi:poly(ADP-ribose) glycohydrolase
MRTLSISHFAGLGRLADDETGFAERLERCILPAIARYAAAAPPPARHRKGWPDCTAISRHAAAGWVARLFLGDLERPPEFPALDAAPLLATTAPHELAKLRCILAYFEHIASEPPRGTFTIERIVGTAHDWERDDAPLCALEIRATGGIEEAGGQVHVDFANSFLGGGVLTGGCVQEEIRFSVAPELLAGLVASPRMGEHEAILLTGSERFSTTTGYAFSLGYAGSYVDPVARLLDGTPDSAVLALDALDYRYRDARAQYSAPAIHRELDKARVGFGGSPAGLPIATGNWGCGAFGGDPAQKAVIQWLAASSVGRNLRYYTRGDERVGDLSSFVARASASLGSVGTLARRLLTLPCPPGPALYNRLLA